MIIIAQSVIYPITSTIALLQMVKDFFFFVSREVKLRRILERIFAMNKIILIDLRDVLIR